MITKDMFPKSLEIDLEVAYKEGREAVIDKSYEQLITVETGIDKKDYVFYGARDRLRRMRGERQPNSFNEYKFTIAMDEWELTRTIKRNVLEDDKTGGKLLDKIRNFGSDVEKSKMMETWEFLRDGVSHIGWDGKQLFHEFHTYKDSSGVDRGITQGNLHTGGSQLDGTTVQLMQQHFSELRNDKNEPFGGMLTHVVVRQGSLNEKSARELANSTTTVEVSTAKGSGTANVFKGAFDIMTTQYGLGASEWMGLDLSGEERPVIVFTHSSAPGWNNMEYTQQLKDSYTGFWRNEFAFGVYGRFDFNCGDWRTAYLHGSTSYATTPADLERQILKEPNA